jgi:hypothetical protein
MAKYRTPASEAFMAGKDAEAAGETLFRTWDNGDNTVDFTTHPEVPKVGVPVASQRTIGWTKKGQRRD